MSKKEELREHELEERKGLELFHDVRLKVTVEFARAERTVAQILALKKNSVMELDKLAGEPLDVRVNNKLVARGEAVIVNEKFGVRVTEIISPTEVTEAMEQMSKKG